MSIEEIEKRKAISFYVRPSIYNEMKRLAQYRGVSVGSLIDDLLSAYLDANREELNAFKELSAHISAAKTQVKTVNIENDVSSEFDGVSKVIVNIVKKS